MSYERLMSVQFELYDHQKESPQILWTTRLVWPVLSSQSFIASKKYTKILNNATIRHSSKLFCKISKLMLISSLWLTLQEYCCVILSISTHVVPISLFIQYLPALCRHLLQNIPNKEIQAQSQPQKHQKKLLKYVLCSITSLLRLYC